MMAQRSRVRRRLDGAGDAPLPFESTSGDRFGAGQTAADRRPTWLLLVLFFVVVGVFVSSPVTSTAGPLGVVATKHIVERRRRRLSRCNDDRLVVALADHIAQQLRGGSSLAASVGQALSGPDTAFPGRLGATRRAIQSGERLTSALRRVDADGLVSLGLLVTALRVLIANGGPAAVSIERVSEALRAGASARAELAAQSGQATASAVLLAALPFLFAVVVAMIEPAAATLYLSTWIGAACVCGAGLLSAAGWWWIDRAVNG